MKSVRLELKLEELTLLASLASDQLFRREFIDPKMPGYKGDPAEVRLGKALVGRLQEIIGQLRTDRVSSSGVLIEGSSSTPSKRVVGDRYAV
jgi:hypothetical protein